MIKIYRYRTIAPGRIFTYFTSDNKYTIQPGRGGWELYSLGGHPGGHYINTFKYLKDAKQHIQKIYRAK